MNCFHVQGKSGNDREKNPILWSCYMCLRSHYSIVLLTSARSRNFTMAFILQASTEWYSVPRKKKKINCAREKSQKVDAWKGALCKSEAQSQNETEMSSKCIGVFCILAWMPTNRNHLYNKRVWNKSPLAVYANSMVLWMWSSTFCVANE